MAPIKIANPEFPKNSFQYNEKDLIQYQKILSLWQIKRLDEKITFLREWNLPPVLLFEQEISYLLSILLRYDLKMFHRHVYGILVDQQPNEIALNEMNALINKCQLQLHSNESSTSEIENAVNAFASWIDLGDKWKPWYPKHDLLTFFMNILTTEHQLLEEKLKNLDQHSFNLYKDNVISVLQSQQYPLVLQTCKAINAIVSKLRVEDLNEYLIENIVNHFVKYVILNKQIAADIKRLGTSIIMQIMFQIGQLNHLDRRNEVLEILKNAFIVSKQSQSENQIFLNADSIYLDLVKNLDRNTLVYIFSETDIIGRLSLIRSVLLSAPIDMLIEGNESLLIDFYLPEMIYYGCIPSDGKEQLYAIYAVEQSIDHIATYLNSRSNIDLQLEEKIVQLLKKALEVVWNNWENAVTNIYDKVREVFKKSIIAHSFLSKQTQSKLSVEDLCQFLLQTDWNRKGKYFCLNLLLPIIGANRLLKLCPNLLHEILKVMDNSKIRTPSGQFYVDLSTSLRTDLESMNSNSEDINNLLNNWKRSCIDPIIESLIHSPKNIREGIIIYPAQRLFKLYPDLIPYVLTKLWEKTNIESHSSRALKSFSHLLMLSKRNSLLKQEVMETYYPLLEKGFNHSNEDIRTHSIEAITACTKTSIPPTEQELDLAFKFISSNLNNCSADYRTKLVDIYKKFFDRIRDSSRNIFAKFKKIKDESSLYTSQPPKQKQLEGLKPSYIQMMNFISKTLKCIEESLYPGSPFEKIQVSISIYQQLTLSFGESVDALYVLRDEVMSTDQPFPNTPLYGSSLCNAFLNAFFGCWDIIRTQIYDILLKFPAPLPGYDNEESTNFMLQNAKKLIERPRLRESDAGALVFRLIFNKYIRELSWDFEWRNNEMKLKKPTTIDQPRAILKFFEEFRLNIENRINSIQNNIFSLSTTHPLVGILCAVRYAFKDLSHKDQAPLLQDWKLFISNLKNHLHKIPEISLQLLADAKNTDDETYENIDDISLPEFSQNSNNLNGNTDTSSEKMYQVDCRGHVYFGSDSKYSKLEVHSLVVNAWLSVRETTMLMGTISQNLYLKANPNGSISNECLGNELFFESMGDLFMNILQSTKHNGVIGKCYKSFIMLCTRLFTCNVPSLAALPGKWINSILEKIAQHSTSILRRSGGFPFIFSAILKAESSLAPTLIKKVMRALLELSHSNNVNTVVNSLNILKFLFHDAELGSSTLPYANDSFIVALDGFCSNHWTVRNSSLMLFSSLLIRTIGMMKTKANIQSTQNCITSREFFSKYPELKNYMLLQLEIATAQDQPKLHPNLYPILLLLSRLSSTASDDPNDPYSADQFIPFVKRCSRSCNFMARSMASRALIPLVPSQSSFEFVLGLLEEISNSKTTNHLHGLILQIHYFLKTNSFNEDQLKSILSIFNSKLSIMNIHCLMLTKAICQVIHLLQKKFSHNYSIITTQSKTVSFLMKGFSNINENMFTLTKNSQMLGIDVALGSWTKCHLTHLQYSQDWIQFEKSTIDALDHWSTNVVIQALKVLQSLPLKEQGLSFSSNVFNGLFTLMQKTTIDAEQLKYCLKTIKYLLESDNASLNKIGDLKFVWNEMHRLYTNYSSCHIRGFSLEILGFLLGYEYQSNHGSFNENGLLTSEINTFLNIIEECCQSNSPKEVRYSCQCAIIDSEILNSSFRAWKCILTLTQDDNENIRTSTAQRLSKFIFSNDQNTKIRLENVVHHAYKKMSSLFQSNPKELSQFLWDKILIPQDEVFAFQNITLDLFDKEIDNLFEEFKFQMDIARDELNALPSIWRTTQSSRILDDLERIEKAFLKSDISNIVCIGGVTYNHDVFLPFYRVLTAATLAFGQVPTEWKQRIFQLFKQDAFVHPIINSFLL